MRASYKWARTKVDSYYGTVTHKSGQSDMSLRNLKASHRTSISAPKSMTARVNEDGNFIRLDESVDVDVSPRYVGGNGYVVGNGYAGGNVYAGGNMYAGQNGYSGGNVYTGQNGYTEGKGYAGGNV